MNLKEAIEFVFGKGVESANAAKAVVIDKLGNGRDVVVQLGDSLAERKIPPSMRGHQVDSVADLCAAAKRWNTNPVLWIDGARVVLVADDDDRRDVVTLPLHESCVFETVKKLAETPKLDQQQLIRLFRTELRNASNVAGLLTAVRRVKFRALREGQSTVQHGSESIGRSIEAEVVGAEAIPEDVLIATNVYKNPGEVDQKFSIKLNLEIDVHNEKFILRPMPDEIEQAVDMALAGIRERIELALPDVPVFFGRP